MEKTTSEIALEKILNAHAEKVEKRWAEGKYSVGACCPLPKQENKNVPV